MLVRSVRSEPGGSEDKNRTHTCNSSPEKGDASVQKAKCIHHCCPCFGDHTWQYQGAGLYRDKNWNTASDIAHKCIPTEPLLACLTL